MRRLLWGLAAVLAALVILPPLWFTAFPPGPVPELPAPGQRIVLPDGTGVNAVSTGEGPAIVLVHGLPGSAYDWRALAPELAARGFRAIAYDRVGYGHSDPRRDGRYSPEANARELEQLLAALGLEQAVVVGWSYGGATAMQAAMADDTRIGRLVLIGTGGPDAPDAEPPRPGFGMRLFYSEPALRWRRAVPPVGSALMGALSRIAFNERAQPDWWLPGLRANLSRWETLLTYRGEMFGIDPESTAGFDASRIRAPTLLLHGEDDRLAPIAISRYLAGVIPDATLVVYEDGSHMLPVTRPDEIAARIDTFVRSGP